VLTQHAYDLILGKTASPHRSSPSDELTYQWHDFRGARHRLCKETGMSDLFWLTDEQIERLRPFFPKSHGKPRVDDRRVSSGIVFVNRNGLRWRDAPSDYGPHKTLYN
jgi:hypothetical protein